jgi:hypothetical protein
MGEGRRLHQYPGRHQAEAQEGEGQEEAAQKEQRITTMATGMIKRGSSSAYTRFIRRWRVRQIKATARKVRSITRPHRATPDAPDVSAPAQRLPE